MDRRLAAILAADVVGYSRLMGMNEAATVAALDDCRALIFGLIGDHDGRVFNTAGDSILAEFGSVVGAVRCAADVQQQVRERNADQAAESRLEFRIGVNQGEIVVNGTEIYGDGINLAARLEALAPSGGIAISGRVHEDVVGKTELAWTDGGERELKNIARPIHVWLWAQDPSPAPAPSLPPPLPDRPSVAVLPFGNLGGGAEDTIFSDGITEDIITGLARFRSLFVVARASSFAFRGSSKTSAEIGRQLGVSYLLEGSVRRSGERVRVTAQLIDAAGSANVWADRFDRSLTDIFDVQDEIANTIVSTLVGRIEDAKLEQSLRKPTENLAAYDLLLRGVARFRSYAKDANREACNLFARAIACDPGYALAHSYLALATIAVHDYGAASPEGRTEASAMARRGVELDPQHGGCHRILGHILLYSRDYDLAEHHSRRTIDLNPNDADGTISMGYLLVQRGRPEDGLMWIEKAMRLNPFHPPWYNAQLASALYSLRRYADVVKAIKRLPDTDGWSFRLAAAYGQLGMDREAAVEAAAVMRSNPGFRVGDFMDRAVLLEQPADRDLLREGLLKAGLRA